MSGYTRKDAAYRAAHRAGYRSRAALKLVELDRRFRLFRSGARVVDLGCWPGGWLQVVAAAVGESGRVVGVDREATEGLNLAHVTILTGDVADPVMRVRARAALGGEADLVVSDLAPQLSGVKVADRERHLALVEVAADWAADLLQPKGRLLVKLFSGLESDAVKLLSTRFASVSQYRPPSTRKGSSEIYALVAERRAGRRG